MTTPTEFSNAVLPHGTTTIVADCHEVANVFGVKVFAITWIFPLWSMFSMQYPSSVPSTSMELETNFGPIDAEQVKALCKRKDVIALGEIMNANDLSVKATTAPSALLTPSKTRSQGFPSKGTVQELLVRCSRVSSPLESTPTTPNKRAASIREKISAGMFLEIQRKSVSKEVIDALKAPELAGRFCFCTDDVLPRHACERGTSGCSTSDALRLGMRPEQVIYAATYSPSRRMNLLDRGQIAPGRRADFVLLDDLGTLRIRSVYRMEPLSMNRDRVCLHARSFQPSKKEYCTQFTAGPLLLSNSTFHLKAENETSPSSSGKRAPPSPVLPNSTYIMEGAASLSGSMA